MSARRFHDTSAEQHNPDATMLAVRFRAPETRWICLGEQLERRQRC
jgi:hypothetical protein